MYCIRHRESFLAWTLAENLRESWEKFETSDWAEAGWAKINGSVEVVHVTVIIMEKGAICA